MKQIAILHAHSDFSLLDSIAKPKQIYKRCQEIGASACAITDHGTICGSVQFNTIFKDIKPIIGVEAYCCNNVSNKDNRDFAHLVVLAKNYDGYIDLCKLTSASNLPENFYYKPRVDLNLLRAYCRGNWIAFSGHAGSHLFNSIFDNLPAVYNASLESSIKKLVSPDAVARTSKLALELQDIFGVGNFYIEIQLIDECNIAGKVGVEVLREVSRKVGIPCVATPDSHYCYRKDAVNQRVLLCTNMHTTLREVQNKMVRGEDVGMGAFFRTDSYHIPEYSEMVAAGNTEGELENTLRIADACERYDLTRPPSPAKFPTPNGISPEEYLTELCRQGYKDKLPLIKKVMEKKGLTKEDYGNRFRHELEVIKEAGLSDYFLTVRDIVQYAINDGQLVGPARGSSAGSLIAYLCGITKLCPLEYNLLFERFYNKARKGAMPDIDSDYMTGEHGRDKVIQYIRYRYGRDKVSNIATYGRMQGRSVLKDVLRSFEACSFEEMGRITEFISDEGSISEKLLEMREADKESGRDGEASIIDYCLDTYPKELSEWCYKDDDGNLQGPLAKKFQVAVSLEGTKRSQGKHAGGVVISDHPLSELVPMIRDKDGNELIAGLEMSDIEKRGLIKLDILGVNALNKLRSIERLVNEL